MKHHRFLGTTISWAIFGLLMWGMTTDSHAQIPVAEADLATPLQRKAAVFVFNREPKVGTQQVKLLEDLVAARVAKLGFGTLTRDVMVDSISKAMRHPTAEVTQKERSVLTRFAASLQKADRVEKNLEELLDEQSSIIRLAQTIGADLIVIVTTEFLGTEKRTFKGNHLAPIATTTIFNNLLISYRLAFAASGAAVAGGSVKVNRAWRESENLTRETDNLLNEMFDEAAADLAKKIAAADQRVKEIPRVEVVNIKFNVKPALPGGTPLQFPVYENGNVKLPVNTTVTADVVIDGVSVGSVPGQLRFATGLHQILVQAEGFKPWKRFVTISEGQAFDILLEMTPEGYENWKEIVTFLSDLSQKTKITDAEVKQIKAKAEWIRRAGLNVTVGDNGLDNP